MQLLCKKKKFINFLTKKHIKNASSFSPSTYKNEKQKNFQDLPAKIQKKTKKNCG